jgi:hypothetical protein
LKASETDNFQSDFSELDIEFPTLEIEPHTNQKKDSSKRKSSYKNIIRDNDSITRCAGFINQVRNVDGVFYVKAGLVIGSCKGSEQNYRANITNVELRVGPTLKVWAEAFQGESKAKARVRLNFVIKNLQFGIKRNGESAFLESRGSIETITYGHID